MTAFATPEIALEQQVSLSRAERIALLRAKIAAVPGKVSTETATPFEHRETVRLPLPELLASLVPHTARGHVISTAGAQSLLLAIIASVTTEGGRVAVVGKPQLNLLGAHTLGADLTRVAVITDPGPDPVNIASILLDGMDLVILGLRGTAISPSRARAIIARARSKNCTLLVTDGNWDGAEIRLNASVDGYDTGPVTAPGRGCIQHVTLSVSASGRAFTPRSTVARLAARGLRCDG